MSVDGAAVAMQVTAEIIVSYLERNQISAAELPELVRATRIALASEGSLGEACAQQAGRAPIAPIEAAPTVPAVRIEDSVTDDYIVSLEDGHRYRSLRRHLMAKHGMSPEQYRAKWGLPADYPMVAPSYARERSEVAKRTGLGRAGAPPEAVPQLARTGRSVRHKGRG